MLVILKIVTVKQFWLFYCSCADQREQNLVWVVI